MAGKSYGEILREERERKRLLGEQALRKTMDEIAHRAIQQSNAQKGRDLQYLDNDFRVEVRNGFDVDHDCFTTDILIFPRDGSGDRHHVVIDEQGNELINEYHVGRKKR